MVGYVPNTAGLDADAPMGTWDMITEPVYKLLIAVSKEVLYFEDCTDNRDDQCGMN